MIKLIVTVSISDLDSDMAISCYYFSNTEIATQFT